MRKSDGRMAVVTRRRYTEDFKQEPVRLVRESARPVAQINLAARYLRDLTRHYGSQDLALLAYNGNLTSSQARYVMRVHRVH